MKTEQEIRNEIVKEIIQLLPIKAPPSRKGKYKAGFYQGCKFVNGELKWILLAKLN